MCDQWVVSAEISERLRARAATASDQQLREPCSGARMIAREAVALVRTYLVRMRVPSMEDLARLHYGLQGLREQLDRRQRSGKDPLDHDVARRFAEALREAGPDRRVPTEATGEYQAKLVALAETAHDYLDVGDDASEQGGDGP